MDTAQDDPALRDELLAQRIAQRLESEPAHRAAQDAFRQLYQRHARKLLAFLASRAGRDDLEDVHQEVWQRVWQRLHEAFHGGNFRAWLYQIARNCALDMKRKRQPALLAPDVPVAARAGDGPDEPLLEQERADILRRCLERLDALSASLVRARLAGEGYADLCGRHGLEPERAHKLFHKAKEQLKTCVERATA